MNQKRTTEWLSFFRCLAILFIIWAHYEYQVFALYEGTNLSMKYFFPPAKSACFFYGITGKYALAVLCVISGYITALQCRNGKIKSVVSYTLTRYVRLLLPITGVAVLYIIAHIVTGGELRIQKALQGLFLLGSDAFDRHLFAILYFFLGNILIVFLFRVSGKRTKVYGLSLLGISMVLLVLVLKRWRLLGGFTTEEILKYQWLFRIYQENLIWIAATMLGAFAATFSEWYLKSKKRSWWFLLLLIPAYYLVRGEESTVIYVRDILAAVCVILAVDLSKASCVFNKLAQGTVMKPLTAISYGMFVSHGIVNSYFSQPFLASIQRSVEGVWVRYVLGLASMTVVTVFVSSIVHIIMEKKLYQYLVSSVDGYFANRKNMRR